MGGGRNSKPNAGLSAEEIAKHLNEPIGDSRVPWEGDTTSYSFSETNKEDTSLKIKRISKRLNTLLTKSRLTLNDTRTLVTLERELVSLRNATNSRQINKLLEDINNLLRS